MKEGPPDPDVGPTRRSALAIIGVGLFALTAGGLTLALGMISNVWRQKQARKWIRVGRAEDLDTGTFGRHVLRVERVHGWVREMRPIVVYIQDNYPDDPQALLATCSHLGCSVRWSGAEEQFQCPCHGGVYDARGAVVEGPPPRPLTRLEVKVDDEEICWVRFPEQAERTA